MKKSRVVPAGGESANGGSKRTRIPAAPAARRRGNIQWWREARYGMFVHYGPFSQWYEQHRAKTVPNTPPPGLTVEERFRWTVEGLKPGRDFARHWAEVAKAAGMKYIVFTAKHHEGFSLWDSKVNDYNSVRMGPGLDMVAEYVSATRKAGLGVGLYYSLWDHHHPDGRSCDHDPAGRRRFLDYTQGLLRELMSNYGKIDLLWYDAPTPLGYSGAWEAQQMNGMIRDLQPEILINDRSLEEQDYFTSENHVNATQYAGQNWEAALALRHGLWTWFPDPETKFLDAREIIDLIRQVTAAEGNLLLNVGPRPAGGIVWQPEQERLATVGRWLKLHGEAVYGCKDRVETLAAIKIPAGAQWTRSGSTAYLWFSTWPDKNTIVLEGVHTKLLACSILSNGKQLKFKQTVPDKANNLATRITISGLPKACPDPVCGCAVLKLRFDAYPQ